jgi:ribonuclease J
MVVVVGLDSETGEMVVGPEVISRGFVYMDESEYIVNEIKEKVNAYFEERTAGVEVDHNVISGDLRTSITKMLYKRTQRRPMIMPIVLEV